MGFFEVLNSRQSVRSFEQRPVEPEKLQQILEVANSAPSAGNVQGFEIYVVRDPQVRSRLVAAAWNQTFVAAAPVLLAFCANPERSATRYGDRGRQLYAVQDATIACAYAMLAAQALGLATVWVGAFETEAVRRLIGACEGHVPVALLPIGYSAEKPQRTGRRAAEDIVHGLSE